MSYYILDETGYVGDAASNSGWDDFAEWAKKIGGYAGSAMEQFLEEGITESVDDVVSELTLAMVESKPEESVASTAVGLIALAKQAKGYILLNNGLAAEDDTSNEL